MMSHRRVLRSVDRHRSRRLRGQQRLTQTPLTEPRYDDSRIEWGATRCYTVRTVETIGGLSLESEAPPPQCQTLVDTFPPSAPKDLQLVAGERSINLIWAPNSEKDVAGYIVLRGVSAREARAHHSHAAG